MNEYQDINPRLPQEEEPPHAKLVPITISFFFAWLFWFVVTGVVSALLLLGGVHLGIPLSFIVDFLVSVVVGFLLALLTVWARDDDLRRWSRRKD